MLADYIDNFIVPAGATGVQLTAFNAVKSSALDMPSLFAGDGLLVDWQKIAEKYEISGIQAALGNSPATIDRMRSSPARSSSPGLF